MSEPTRSPRRHDPRPASVVPRRFTRTFASRVAPVIVLVAALGGSFAPAQSTTARWPQFRGPDVCGSIAATKAPLTFDREKGAAWRLPLPPGHSSPCIWGNHIFLTAQDGNELVALAVDRAKGEVLWRHAIPLRRKTKFAHQDANRAMPTPCTNGKRVFFYFGDFGLIALDFDGKVAWEKRMKPPRRSMFGIGTSPVVIDDAVILCRDGCAPSAIHAFEESTGKERWTTPRLTYGVTYATPLLWENEDRREIVIASSRRITGLDPTNGDVLWEVDGVTPLVCTTPVADRGTLYFAGWSTGGAHGLNLLQSLFGDIDFTPEEVKDAKAAYARLDTNDDGKIQRDELPMCRAKDCFEMADRNKNDCMDFNEFKPFHSMPASKGENIAVAITPGGKGDVTKSHVRWRFKRGIPYVSAPLLHGGRFYMLKSRGILTCLDPKTGKPLYGPVRLSDRGEYYASPVGCGESVVMCSTSGTIYVLKASDAFQIERTIEFGERIFASPAIVDDCVYLRTEKALWAFGAKS